MIGPTAMAMTVAPGTPTDFLQLGGDARHRQVSARSISPRAAPRRRSGDGRQH
jgi:hypothetical protein